MLKLQTVLNGKRGGGAKEGMSIASKFPLDGLPKVIEELKANKKYYTFCCEITPQYFVALELFHL